MNHQLVAGLVLGCASAAAANAGVVVEKLAMRRMPPFDARNSTDMVWRLVRNPFWFMGFSMIAIGLAVQVLALSLASISVVQAVAPTGTVLLLVLSHIFLGDRLRRMEYAGIAALVVALGLLVLSLDPHADRATGSTTLSALLAVTIPAMSASFALFAFASHTHGSDQHRKRVKAPIYGLATGLLYGCAALDMKAVSTLMQRWGVVPAIPRIVESPVLYLLLLTTVLAFLMFQLALQRSITSVLVPVSSVLSTGFFMIVGDALFHQHLPRAPLSLSLRLASFALLAVGLFAVTAVNEAHPAEESEREIPVGRPPLSRSRRLGASEKVPGWAWLVVSLGCMAVIAVVRDVHGVAGAGVPVLFLLPIAWLALSGRRLYLLAGLVGLALALLVPFFLVGQTHDSTHESAVVAGVAAFVAIIVFTRVSKHRAALSEMAGHSRIVHRNAAENAWTRHRLDTLLQAATDDAFLGVDPRGFVTFFSAGAEQLLGFCAAEVVGIRSLTDFFDLDQVGEHRRTLNGVHDHLEPCEATPEAQGVWTATRKDGRRRRCAVRVRALRDSTPESDLDADTFPCGAGYVVIATDVTQSEELVAGRKLLETLHGELGQSLIVQNDRLRELTQMKADVVGAVSPETRAVIASIRDDVAALLEDSSELAQGEVDMLRTMERNAEQLQQVAENLRADPTAGRGLSPSFRELDLAGLVEEAVDAIQTSSAAAAVKVTMRPCTETVRVLGDRTRLQELLGSLLSNAVKFSPRYGRVHVAVDTVGDHARIQFMDEGPGIPRDKREQIFVPRSCAGSQTGALGSGLGLLIAQSVAEAHGGFVDVVETPGWSSNFRVFLPLAYAHGAGPAGIASTPHCWLGTSRSLTFASIGPGALDRERPVAARSKAWLRPELTQVLDR
jgi:PAS domain S-box-containing protein